jgi:hypothetical protein
MFLNTFLDLHSRTNFNVNEENLTYRFRNIQKSFLNYDFAKRKLTLGKAMTL